MYRQFFPGYSIGVDAYDDINTICTSHGRTAVVIGGEKAIAAARPAIEASNTGIKITGYFPYGGEASRENMLRLAAIPEVAQANMIFAVGGGRAIDTAKVLAQTSKRPFFGFPTIASTCAACTSLGIIYHPDGSLQEYSFSKITPAHVFINSQIIANAPQEYLWAGIGDTMAKYYECTVSGRGDELLHADAMGSAISTMCAQPLVEYGVKAMEDCKKHLVTDELEEVILGIVISTGFVSNLVDINYNTGMAHAIYNGTTMLPQVEEKGHLHGEVVSYGILVLLTADKQTEERQRIFDFNKSMGLPTKLADIDITEDEIDIIVTKALEGIDIKHYPYEVTAEVLSSAILELEEFNRGK